MNFITYNLSQTQDAAHHIKGIVDMDTIDLSPEAIQAHLENGARLRAEAIQGAFSNLGATISGAARAVGQRLTGDWTGGRTA